MAEDALIRPPADPVRLALGIENVLLAYCYRDLGDLDGYASLLHECVATAADRGRCQDRPTLLRMAEHDDPTTRHRIDRIMVDGPTVVVMGRLVGEFGDQETAFVDVVELSDCCLLISLSRYVAQAPGHTPRDDHFPHIPATK